MLFLKHCCLNLLRAPRRTLMIFLLLSFGTAALFLTNSYRYGLYQTLADVYRISKGDFQIGRTGSLSADYNRKKELIAADLYAELQPLLAAQAGLIAADPTLSFSGMVGDQRGSVIAGGIGVDPAITNRGVLFGTSLKSGQRLASDQPSGALLSVGLKKKLDVNEGDYLTLLTTTARGAFAPANIQTHGSFSLPGGGFDIVFLPLEYVQRIRQTRAVENLQVFVSPGTEVAPIIAALEQEFQQRQWPLEIKTWRQLTPFYDQIRAMYDLLFAVMLAIVTALAVIAVFEMLSMSFLERMRELGTLRAVGNTRAQIFALLAVEIFLLTLGGLLLGALVSFVSAAVLNKIAIPFTPPGSSESFPLHFPLRWTYLLQPTAILLVVGMLSGIGPALTATRLKVVEVLRHD